MQRRRFIQIAATAAGMSLCPQLLRAQKLQPVRWQGYTLGAIGQFTLYTETPAAAKAILQTCFAEIQRLEKIFSLYQTHSELSTLNREGRLTNASPDMVAALHATESAYQLTKGGFDPTVQPLWQLYAKHFEANPESQDGPSERELQSTLTRVGWQKVDMSGSQVGFRAPGMSLTLNGIAQGYITDRVTEILKAAGYQNVLVELGETRALGPHPDKRPWQIGIQSADRTQVQDTVSLENQALATSGGYGSPFSQNGAFHHLIHPQTGRPASTWQSLSVIAPTATEADALSTGLSVANRQLIDSIQSSRSDLSIRISERI